jgi:hypothetical protein
LVTSACILLLLTDGQEHCDVLKPFVDGLNAISPSILALRHVATLRPYFARDATLRVPTPRALSLAATAAEVHSNRRLLSFAVAQTVEDVAGPLLRPPICGIVLCQGGGTRVRVDY